MEQGRVAGAAMAGKDAQYKGTVPANTLKVVGIDLMAVGEIDPEGTMESITSKNEMKSTYRKLVLKDNVIIGALFFGDVHGSEEIQNAIKTKLDITSIKDDLADEKFDFAGLRR
jgi:nitrite reductase (NADH) large subunit